MIPSDPTLARWLYHDTHRHMIEAWSLTTDLGYWNRYWETLGADEERLKRSVGDPDEFTRWESEGRAPGLQQMIMFERMLILKGVGRDG